LPKASSLITSMILDYFTKSRRARKLSG
jgi:hypothetical protein